MIIRWATPDDVPAIVGLIGDLAAYEHLADEAVAREEDIHDALFRTSPHVFCHVAEIEGEVVGMALWFLNFSTFLGSSGLYLEDLYVSGSHRGKGIGKGLMRELARLCLSRGYTRFQWWVLDWNSPSIEFYQSIGAVAMDEWTVFRLSGDALRTFGTSPEA